MAEKKKTKAKKSNAKAKQEKKGITWHILDILKKSKKELRTKDIIQRLKKRGVETSAHYVNTVISRLKKSQKIKVKKVKEKGKEILLISIA